MRQPCARIRSALPVINGHHGVHPAGSATLNSKPTAESFKNPDWTAITLHAYRSRWKTEPADERYQPLKSRLASVETIGTPTLMIQGDVDRCNPPSESAGQARHFTGPYKRVLLKDVGHFPAREAPEQVAQIA